MGIKKKEMLKKVAASKNTFIAYNDSLANIINEKTDTLYHLLLNIDCTKLATGDEYREYFIKHHLGNRLFFSLQNSAHIIYHSVKKSGKAVNEIVFMDYGAGLGTLFMLAGMMGFKKTVYNDYLPEWHQPAKALCEALQIKINDYVAGDIDNVIQHAKANNIQYDIIASRNVIEHIYDLPHFYQSIFNHNPKTITYSTTTANYHNPAMRWYHLHIHHKVEKAYYNQRIDEIKKLHPELVVDKLPGAAKATRGKGQQDFVNTVNDFLSGKAITKDNTLRSNTCDCITGVWCEHLLTKKEYGILIKNAGFKMEYTPGYWDTHYKWGIINVAAKAFNKIILLLGNNGIILSPFINVITYN